MGAPDPDPTVTPGSVPSEGAGGATVHASIIDWSRTARRLRTVLLGIGGTAVTLWLVLGFIGDGPSLRLLAELGGIGILCVFAVEVVVVGGAAIRGMFTAGERGERLASQDVFLLPPQLLRGRRATGSTRSTDQG